MSSPDVPVVASTQRSRTATMAGGLLFIAVVALGLTWAKWYPYGHRLRTLWDSHRWTGTSVLAGTGHATGAPSWHATWSFTVAYGKAVWMALVAALIIAAAMEALVPQERLVALLARRSRAGGSLVAGLLAIPCMMCTCCTAPVATSLRRRGVPTGSVLGYWLGNPVLNPAVLAFLALVAPWQWVAVRAAVGALLVFGVSVAVARVTDRSAAPVASPTAEAPVRLSSAPLQFCRTLARLTVTLVPEYLFVVLALGAFRGWLFPISGVAHWGALAVLVAAIAGTLLVIPTAGEIPILQGLAAAGLGAGPLGALLITLPAVSLPSMVMVSRALTWRVTVATAVAVAGTGLAAGAMLWALT